MTSGNECVKHALLSFFSAYVLDYCPTETFRVRANFHYRRAAELLDQEIRKPEASQVGQEDAIVGVMALLLSNDVCLIRSKDSTQTPTLLSNQKLTKPCTGCELGGPTP